MSASESLHRTRWLLAYHYAFKLLCAVLFLGKRRQKCTQAGHVSTVGSLAFIAVFFLCAPWQVVKSKEVTYYYADQQGTVLTTTNEQGAVTSVADFRPYGVQAAGASTKMGAAGTWHDDESDLTYMQARYYDPSIGVFFSVDPMGVTPVNLFAFSRYAYANNNPTSNQDPTGMECESSQGGARSGQSCPPPPPPRPPPTDPVEMAAVVVTATTTSTGVGAAGAGSKIFWAGGLVTLGASLYVVDSNGFNEFVTGHRGCYGDASCQGPLLHLSRKEKVPIPGVSGKDGAKDVPSWAKGQKPYVGESGKDFADRLIKDKTGGSPTDRGPNSDFNKIKKWGDRSFKDP